MTTWSSDTSRMQSLAARSLPNGRQPTHQFRPQTTSLNMLQNVLRSKPWRRGFLLLFVLFFLRFLSTSHTPVASHLKSQSPETTSACFVFEWIGLGSSCRANKVKAAFIHAYHGYEQYAAPNDELRPVSNGFSDGYGGWAATAIDSLDTMVIMGLKEEYQRALGMLGNTSFEMSAVKQNHEIRFFEIVIRYLGGMLSAYALTKNKMILSKAEELANTLDFSFNSPSGFPYVAFRVDSQQRPHNSEDYNMCIADLSSFHLEYEYLGRVTGNFKYLNRTRHVRNILAQADVSMSGGMFPVWWSPRTGLAQGAYGSVGALADSAHEYLLKLYLLSGKKDKQSIEMYLRMTTEVISRLLFISPNRKLLYVTDSYDIYSSRPSHKMEHLACFFPGLLALGAHTLPLDDLGSIGIDGSQLYSDDLHGQGRADFERLSRFNLAEVHMWAAEGLAQTCYLSYADSESGLGPDEIWMSTTPDPPTLWLDALEEWKYNASRRHGRWRKFMAPGLQRQKPMKDVSERDYTLKQKNYLLRPEVVESLYILWRTTGRRKYQQWAWEIFQSIERVAKTDSGYTHITHVDVTPPTRGDIMPSFFLAETLKYLYLIFRNDDPIPLDKWVFNTEAHPLPILVQ